MFDDAITNYERNIMIQTSAMKFNHRTILRWVRKVGYSLKSDVESRTLAQGQGQECSRSRPSTKNTSASVLKKKKKRSSKKIFQAISRKKRLPKIFSGNLQNLNNSKNSAVLEPRTGQFSKT